MCQFQNVGWVETFGLNWCKVFLGGEMLYIGVRITFYRFSGSAFDFESDVGLSLTVGSVITTSGVIILYDTLSK
jgi:hypothetical protein